MIGDQDIFVTEIISRKIGIKITFNKERKSAIKMFRSLGTMNISVGLCKII